jgi:hypothetical protein
MVIHEGKHGTVFHGAIILASILICSPIARSLISDRETRPSRGVADGERRPPPHRPPGDPAGAEHRDERVERGCGAGGEVLGAPRWPR